MEGTEKPVNPKDVIVSLDIGDSTLRKWCLAIEAQGYNFPRTDNNRRVFFQKDLELLRHFRNMVQVQNFSLEHASLLVVAKVHKDASEEKNTDNAVPAIRDNGEIIHGLLEHIERQETFNQQLIERLDEQQRFNEKLFERLDQQQKYIDDRLNRRDEMLMQSMRESQETKQLLLAAQEERKKRKGIFKFFSKD